MTTEVQATIDAYWTDRADGYHEFQESRVGNPEIRAAWERVWAGALPPPPADVLDVGCGTGHMAILLDHLGHRVTGIDGAEGMVRRAQATAARAGSRATFRLGDAVEPVGAPASLDAITGRYVLWTLREPARALAAWRGLLRPGGRLALVDATWFADGIARGPADADSPFRQAYREEVRASLPLAEQPTMDAAVALVRAAGFVDVERTELHDLLELDQRFGVAPGHRPELQHLITATRPA